MFQVAEPRVTVEVDGRELSLSNLDKHLYPNGFTKAEVIRYVTAAAPVWLPHLAERALTMVRFPNGTDGTSFFEKRRPSHAPEWVAGTPLWVTSGSERWGKPAKPGKVPTREEVTFVVVDGVATLVWLANLACLELHTPMGRAAGPWGSMVPTMVVLDLDPGAPATAVECAVVALRIKAVLDELSLESVVKSSGSKGLQVYVPLNRPDATFDRTRAFAQAAGRGGQRVVYLGALGPSGPASGMAGDNPSAHLRSRQEVGRILRDGADTVELKAAIVIGRGGVSFEIMRQLVDRLPVMICPRWVTTRCQPIALPDVVRYLVGALDLPAGSYDVGGPDVLTYEQMMRRYAELTGRRRFILKVPVLSPTLSSHWIGLVTDQPASIARPLAEGLSVEVVVTDDRIRSLIPFEPLGFDDAVSLAMTPL